MIYNGSFTNCLCHRSIKEHASFLPGLWPFCSSARFRLLERSVVCIPTENVYISSYRLLWVKKYEPASVILNSHEIISILGAQSNPLLLVIRLSIPTNPSLMIQVGINILNQFSLRLAFLELIVPCCRTIPILNLSNLSFSYKEWDSTIHGYNSYYFYLTNEKNILLLQKHGLSYVLGMEIYSEANKVNSIKKKLIELGRP